MFTATNENRANSSEDSVLHNRDEATNTIRQLNNIQRRWEMRKGEISNQFSYKETEGEITDHVLFAREFCKP